MYPFLLLPFFLQLLTSHNDVDIIGSPLDRWPYDGSLSHSCWRNLIVCIWVHWKALHLIYSLEDACCPVKASLAFSAILLMSQVIIVGSQLCLSSSRLHISNSSGSVEYFFLMFEIGVRHPTLPKTSHKEVELGLTAQLFPKILFLSLLLILSYLQSG